MECLVKLSSFGMTWRPKGNCGSVSKSCQRCWIIHGITLGDGGGNVRTYKFCAGFACSLCCEMEFVSTMPDARVLESKHIKA